MTAGNIRYETGASTEDLNGLTALHAAAVTAGYRHIFPTSAMAPTADSLRAAWVELLADTTTRIVVAKQGDVVVGSIVLAPDDSVPVGLLVKRLHVLPNHWGRGIGAALHDRALHLARELGAEKLNLWVLEENRRARAMYERRGWSLVEPRRTLANEPATIIDVLYEIDLAETSA